MARYSLHDLLSLIDRNGGPEGLNLANANLSELDARPEALAAELALAREADPGAQPAWLSPETGALDLHGADLHGADLSGANLREAALPGANLRGADLNHADLRQTNLERVALEGADLQGADLRESSLAEAGLEGADLEGCDMRQVKLTRANLTGCNLEGTNLREAGLTEADLHGADLQGADLRQANLTHANLKGCDLESARLEEATLFEANLEEADLEDANLRQANLSNANLLNATLDGADLREANLEGTGRSATGAADDTEAGEPYWRPDVEEARRMARESGALAAEIAREVSQATSEAVREAGRAVDEAMRGVGHDIERAVATEDLGSSGREFSLSVPCEGATGLRVDVGLGNVALSVEEREDILVNGRGRQEELEVTHEGDTIRIRQKRHNGSRGWFGFGRSHRLDLTLALPAALTRLEAHTGFGNIDGQGLRTADKLSTGKGNIRLVDCVVDGDLSTGMGNVDVVACTGAGKANTGHGNVTLEDVSGGRWKANSGRGNVAVRKGRFEALRATTGAGNVNASLALAEVQVHLESGAGVVDVELPADASAQIEAVTGMGQVRSDWPLVKVGRPGPAVVGSMRMVGPIGGGSERVRVTLRTGMGNVSIRRAGGVAEAPAAPAAPESAPVVAPEAPRAPEAPPAPVAPESPKAPAQSDAEARLAILQSLARGEISVDEAESLILHLDAE